MKAERSEALVLGLLNNSVIVSEFLIMLLRYLLELLSPNSMKIPS